MSSVREPPGQAGEHSAGIVGRDDAGIVQELQLARRQQVLSDEIEIQGLTRMPSDSEIKTRVGGHGLIEETANIEHGGVKFGPVWKIELRA